MISGPAYTPVPRLLRTGRYSCLPHPPVQQSVQIFWNAVCPLIYLPRGVDPFKAWTHPLHPLSRLDSAARGAGEGKEDHLLLSSTLHRLV